MDDQIVALPGMRRRYLKMDAVLLAMSIAPALDHGDRDAAVAIWLEWRERAYRSLARKGLSQAAARSIIGAASAEVREEIVRIRGSATLGRVDPAMRPIPARLTAAVLPFRLRAGGAT